MDASDFVTFTGHVPGTGFRWAASHKFEWDVAGGTFERRDAVEWWLVTAPARGLPFCRTVTPLRDHPGLFRVFAAIDVGDREAVRRFADRFGWLGATESVFINESDPELPLTREEVVSRLGASVREGDSEGKVDGEKLAVWQAEVERMRFSVTLWEAVIARNLSVLQSHLRPATEEDATELGEVQDGHEAWVYHSDPADIAEPFSWDNLVGRCFGGAVEAPIASGNDRFLYAATAAVEQQINSQLNTDAHWKDAESRPLLLVGRAPDGKLSLRLEPPTLLSALWFQFAQAVTGDKRFRECRVCGTWFSLAPEGGERKARQVFCSDPCKFKDYRRRKGRATELRAEGLRPPAIAERLKAEGLETDLETVKKWTTKKRGR
jgi:hypothetical protein